MERMLHIFFHFVNLFHRQIFHRPVFNDVTMTPNHRWISMTENLIQNQWKINNNNCFDFNHRKTAYNTQIKAFKPQLSEYNE